MEHYLPYAMALVAFCVFLFSMGSAASHADTQREDFYSPFLDDHPLMKSSRKDEKCADSTA